MVDPALKGGLGIYVLKDVVPALEGILAEPGLQPGIVVARLTRR